jgi:hypothetical protein
MKLGVGVDMVAETAVEFTIVMLLIGMEKKPV